MERNERLKAARERAGVKSAAAAARRLGVPYGTYSGHENGLRGIKDDELAAYAKAYRVPLAWLAYGEGSPDALPRQADLVGYVAAGAAATVYGEGQGPFDTVDAPEGSNENTVAVEVRGTSLGPALDQWLVFYDRVEDPPNENLNNKLCVVGLPDGRILVKQLRKARANGLWHLYSNYADEPILDQEVVWAAPVRAMTPRG